MWNKWLPFRKGALRGTSTSVISTCSCWCCLTRFPSLPALKIFSPKLIFRDRLLKSSFRDEGDLGAVLAGKGRAKREGLDILTLQEFTCSKKQILKILPPAQRLGSRLVQLQLGLKRRAASSISFKQQAQTGWSHSPHLPDLWNVKCLQGESRRGCSSACPGEQMLFQGLPRLRRAGARSCWRCPTYPGALGNATQARGHLCTPGPPCIPLPAASPSNKCFPVSAACFIVTPKLHRLSIEW